jgi:LuxR family maltose regulon positive regulatory protein
VIQDRLILQVLERLVTDRPPPLHLVLLTREDPSLPLARLRAHNQMTEIRASDLRFSRVEAGRILTETLGLSLSPADTAMLEDRTEGWVVGLQLAGLSVRDRADPSAFIQTLSGGHAAALVAGWMEKGPARGMAEAIGQALGMPAGGHHLSTLDRYFGNCARY